MGFYPVYPVNPVCVIRSMLNVRFGAGENWLFGLTNSSTLPEDLAWMTH